VVNDKIDGDTRVDAVGVTAETLGGVTHSGQVDNARDTGEVLQDNTGRLPLDLSLAGLVALLCILVGEQKQAQPKK
jgi:hypothetical protein